MKIYIGNDHAGFELKKKLKAFLVSLAYEVEDKGAFSYDENDDYPDFIKYVAEAVSIDSESKGIVLGGSGQGEAICANRTKNVRACEFYGGNLEVVKISREHNDANILSLGAKFVSDDEAKKAVKIFLETKFSNDERHIRRIKKIESIEPSH